MSSKNRIYTNQNTVIKLIWNINHGIDMQEEVLDENVTA